MRLIEDLRTEHELIERVVASLRTFVSALAGGQADPADAARFLAFFRHYAGAFHHDKEEAVLFQALVDRAELPADRGPISALTQEHRRLASLLDALEGFLKQPARTTEEQQRLEALAREYCHGLWRHIDAENSVLFPEGQERLRRVHVLELPSRAMTAPEREAQEAAARLLAAYPPGQDNEALRGEGCMLCPSYGTSCEGLEVAWWTEDEWDETRDRFNGE